MRLRRAFQHPPDMRPPAAIARRVRVAGPICMRMMNAMGNHPVDRAALEGQQSEQGQNIFDYLWRFIAAMRQEPVKTHPYTETCRDPPEHNGYYHCLPAEHE